MNKALRLVAASLVCVNLSIADAHPSSSLSLREYHQKLLEIADRIQSISDDDAKKLEAGLPASEKVQTEAGTRTADLTWLHQALQSYIAENDASKKRDLLSGCSRRLSTMREQSGLNTALSEKQTRPRLEEILARREFRYVEGETAWDVVMRKLDEWIGRAFTKLFGSSGHNRTVGEIIVWTLITIAIALCSVLLTRRLKRIVPKEPTRVPVPFATIAGKGWRAWVSEARMEASAKRYREAVHALYWANILRMGDAGLWHVDDSLTPREYLALLSQAPQSEAFHSVVKTFEAVWYGYAPASQEEYLALANSLESLSA